MQSIRFDWVFKLSEYDHFGDQPTVHIENKWNHHFDLSIDSKSVALLWARNSLYGGDFHWFQTKSTKPFIQVVLDFSALFDFNWFLLNWITHFSCTSRKHTLNQTTKTHFYLHDFFAFSSADLCSFKQISFVLFSLEWKNTIFID